ncbi:MAG: DNA polymerase III subunit delta [Gemmatimonadetes bacterium]|nr:DNA polymerase III subunit delta [Gemmatimonadota bacterium]
MTLLQLPPVFAKVRGGVFYLYGEDAFRKEEVVSALIDAHLDSATRDFNHDQLRGTETDVETLASVLATPPMMARWRVVVVREVEGFASGKKARETILEVVNNPPPGLALILSCTVPQGSRAKFYRDLSSAAHSVEFRAFTGADLPGWLIHRAEEAYSVEIEVEAARALSAAIGTNLGVLDRELEKLTDFVGDRSLITIGDVEAVGTKLPSQDRWRWFDLVGERRFQEALTGLDVLIGQGESGVGLVIGLATHLLRLGVASTEGLQSLEAALPPHQKWLAKSAMAQGKKWPSGELDAALEGLLRADRLLKASPHSDQHFVEEWLLGLMSRAVAA